MIVGFLKVTLSLFSMDNDETPEVPKKGEIKTKVHSQTGRNRVLILASVPKVSETYENVQILINLLKIKLLEQYQITGKQC